MKKYILITTLFAIILSACNHTHNPKPNVYFRLTFPEAEYQVYETDTCPYIFEYSKFAHITPSDDYKNPACWYNINYDGFNGHIYLTLRQIDNNLDSLLDDSHTLVYKHVVKADAINSQEYINDSLKVYATMFYIEGNAASPLQFQIMDSTHYFVRGSVYFDVEPNSDSLAPAIEYITEDVRHFVETFKWKNDFNNACL